MSETDQNVSAQQGSGSPATGTARVKRGMAEMLKGGVIMDVVTPDQAKIAEDAGAVAVMALERVPADIRAQGGVARARFLTLLPGNLARRLHCMTERSEVIDRAGPGRVGGEPAVR